MTSWVVTAEQALGAGVRLDSPGVPRATLGAVVFLTLLWLFSEGAAMVLRSAAVGLSVLIPFHLVLPTVLFLIPGLRPVASYLPALAGSRLMQVVRENDAPRTAAEGLAVLLAWTVAALAAGCLAVRSRDA